MSITKYQRSDVVGEEWLRAKRVIFENPPEGALSVRFAEERAVALADGTIVSKQMGILEASRQENELDEAFELLDPTTGEGSGSYMTYAQLYGALYSLYLKTSQEARGTLPADEPIVDPGPEETPPVE